MAAKNPILLASFLLEQQNDNTAITVTFYLPPPISREVGWDKQVNIQGVSGAFQRFFGCQILVLRHYVSRARLFCPADIQVCKQHIGLA